LRKTRKEVSNNGENVEAEMMVTKTKLIEIEQQKINRMGHILKANVLSEEEKIIIFNDCPEKTKER
jgi:predicted AAA+ superfamily ATPase